MKADNDRFPVQVQKNVHHVFIKELVRPAHQVNGEMLVSSVKQLMLDEEVISSVVVVSEGLPVGLVMNFHLDRILSQRYGVALFTNQPIEVVMDGSPLVIDCNTPLEEASNKAMAREPNKMYDHLIVVEGEKLLGVVSVQTILKKLAALQKQSYENINQFNDRLREEIRNKKCVESELRNLNRNLEKRVEERTAELVGFNEELKTARNAAIAANMAKSDFLANMSHELRTPLNHIIGFTELVLGPYFGSLNEQQSEYLNDVLSSSKHLLSLINDILDLSKVEAGKMELEYSDIDMKHLLKNSLVMVKERAMKHNIKLSAKADKLPFVFQADERKLKQIIYNLLSNAVKFTPDGGCIQVFAQLYETEVARLSDGGGEIVFDPSTEYLLVSVEDTGIGIKKEDIDRIFDPFEQADSSRSRKYQGTGLGLSLTKKLVESHNGKLWAESQGEGKGATFKLVIPCRPPEAASPAAQMLIPEKVTA